MILNMLFIKYQTRGFSVSHLNNAELLRLKSERFKGQHPIAQSSNCHLHKCCIYRSLLIVTSQFNALHLGLCPFEKILCWAFSKVWLGNSFYNELSKTWRSSRCLLGQYLPWQQSCEGKGCKGMKGGADYQKSRSAWWFKWLIRVFFSHKFA